ncbi:MAG: PIN domain-containing protein [Armatimonadota bacterium]|nr:PIN domain-containing protein [Armatimonadota bacterium]
MDRLFLDANVIFSAAYVPGSRLLELWSLGGVELVTSLFAVEEARRNLTIHNRDGLVVLDDLVSRMTVVAGTKSGSLPDGVELPNKDAPILTAAIESGCGRLLTGDKRHFGDLLGREVGGVLIQTPAQYLREADQKK